MKRATLCLWNIISAVGQVNAEAGWNGGMHTRSHCSCDRYGGRCEETSPTSIRSMKSATGAGGPILPISSGCRVGAK
ncbi:hypothetical protein ACFQ3W_14895 [Paenibacillus puldeungensis]|uniref:Secreted protein n=1 Tax=Paenibacillus puldeungensis TaxID=696536 RepID=A0ABW3RYR6_9BACL